MTVVTCPEKVFEINSAEVTWLRMNHPGNYRNLEVMLRAGRAKIIDHVPGVGSE